MPGAFGIHSPSRLNLLFFFSLRPRIEKAVREFYDLKETT